VFVQHYHYHQGRRRVVVVAVVVVEVGAVLPLTEIREETRKYHSWVKL